MEATDKVMEILNNSQKSKEMLKMFQDAIKADGMQGEQLKNAEETMMGLIIASNPEAMQAMAEEVYNEINGIGVKS